MNRRVGGCMGGWEDKWIQGQIYPSLSDIINNHTAWVSEKTTEFGVGSSGLREAPAQTSWPT